MESVRLTRCLTSPIQVDNKVFQIHSKIKRKKKKVWRNKCGPQIAIDFSLVFCRLFASPTFSRKSERSQRYEPIGRQSSGARNASSRRSFHISATRPRQFPLHAWMGSPASLLHVFPAAGAWRRVVCRGVAKVKPSQCISWDSSGECIIVPRRRLSTSTSPRGQTPP